MSFVISKKMQLGTVITTCIRSIKNDENNGEIDERSNDT